MTDVKQINPLVAIFFKAHDLDPQKVLTGEEEDRFIDLGGRKMPWGIVYTQWNSKKRREFTKWEESLSRKAGVDQYTWIHFEYIRLGGQSTYLKWLESSCGLERSDVAP